MKKKVPILLFILFLFIGCSSKNMKNYKLIKQSSSNIADLYLDIYSFDLKNPDFYESKLDLARYYLLVGNYNEALAFLLRAEAIAAKFPEQMTKENEAAMYGCHATLLLMNNQVESAFEYVEKACNVPKYGKIYGYLAGRVLTTLDRKQEALVYFEKTYKEYPNLITGEEIRSYMYLLADSKNYKKALELLELYFEKGAYFSGLGMFASGIYEKNGLLGESIFSAFLDYEYQSCFGNSDDKKFVQNLNDLRSKLVLAEDDKFAVNVVDYMLSLYIDADVSKPDMDFFPVKYIELKKIAKNKSWSNKEFNEYLALEKYFKNFPCYYWNLWKMLPRINSGDLSNWKSVLEKIILLGKSEYYEPAKISLGKLSGLNSADSSKLLLPQEVQNLLWIYFSNGDEKLLDYVYDFLALPDCDYILQGYQIIKNNLNNNSLRQAFLNKSKTANGRLKERIDYILN